MARKSWVQHPETGKLIPKEEYVRPTSNPSAFVRGDNVEFVSPVDNSVVSGQKALREHNARNGVVDSREYGGHFCDAQAKARRESVFVEGSGFDKKARVEAVKKAIYEHEHGYRR